MMAYISLYRESDCVVTCPVSIVSCDITYLLTYLLGCMVVCCSGTLGVGFYGNEEMKKGDNSMYSAVDDAKDIVTDVHKQVCQFIQDHLH